MNKFNFKFRILLLSTLLRKANVDDFKNKVNAGRGYTTRPAGLGGEGNSLLK